MTVQILRGYKFGLSHPTTQPPRPTAQILIPSLNQPLNRTAITTSTAHSHTTLTTYSTPNSNPLTTQPRIAITTKHHAI